MLPGNFLGFAINGNGGILLVPFNKSGNQFGGPYNKQASAKKKALYEAVKIEDFNGLHGFT